MSFIGSFSLRSLFSLNYLSRLPIIPYCEECDCLMTRLRERIYEVDSQGFRSPGWELYYCWKCYSSTAVLGTGILALRNICRKCYSFGLSAETEILRKPTRIRGGKVRISTICKKCGHIGDEFRAMQALPYDGKLTDTRSTFLIR